MYVLGATVRSALCSILNSVSLEVSVTPVAPQFSSYEPLFEHFGFGFCEMCW